MILDLTNVKDAVTKERFKNHLLLPIKLGDYERDFDVIEKLCDPSFLWKERYRVSRIKRKMGFRPRTRPWTLPIGFDLKHLPKGAVIIHEH